MKRFSILTMFVVFIFVSCGDGKAVPGDLPELEWSEKAENEMSWEDAKKYCEDLKEKDKDDWKLPTIDELRTLVVKCPDSEYQGACPISEEVNQLTYTEDWNTDKCSGCTKSNHSKFGDKGWFWSSSALENTAWRIDFDDAYIYGQLKEGLASVRCVRNAK
ncbi:DUF1566 domain-containing protein [bacterium]|nr:DUF1566 domain-containing protein [bacterium]